MASIIDQFVVTLGLDPTQYVEGEKKANAAFKSTKDAAHTAGKDMEASGAQAAKFFSQIKNEAMSLGLVLFGGVGIAEFIRDTITGNAAIGRFSANIGTSTEKLSAWEGAIKSVGGTVQDVTGSLGALSSAYQNYLLGRMPSADFIQGLQLLNRETGSNITMADMADPTVAAQKLAAAAQHLSKPRARTILGMLGQSENMINLETMGPEKLNALLNRMQHVTDAQARAAEETQAQLAITTGKFKDLSNELITDLLPTLDRVAGFMTKTFGWLKAENDRMAADYNAAPPKPSMAPPNWSAAEWAWFLISGQRPAARQATAAPVGVAAPGGGGNGSLADRNNNPGNLTDGRGHFLHFPTRQAGFLAMALQLKRDYDVHGQRTISQIINDPAHGWSNQWAPGNTAASTANYIAAVSRAMGVGPNDAFPAMKGDTLTRLMLAMNAVERGGGSVAHVSRHHRATHTAHHSRAETHIGTINVNGVDTNRADAVAQGLKPAISRYGTVTQANTGLF